jgi:hypothetical protein
MTKILRNKSNIDLDYPICRPSLDLDFTQEELDPRITFTRGSIGTRVNRNRVIETVAANTPRFDYDPVTGECKGLLIEESRQNLLTYSDDHSNGVWIGQGISAVSSNTIVAPDGTLTADKIVGTSGQRTRQSIYQSVSVTSGVKYTFSRFLKAGERKYVCMWFDNPNITEGAYFGAYTYVDLELGRIVFNSNSNVSITEYPNKWYRFTISATPSFTGTLSLNTSMGTPNNYLDVGTPDIYKYVGDGNSGFYTWGAQLEAGAFPTSYIPTVASTVTRSADLASMTGTNFSSWYNQSEGTLYADLNNITTRTSLTYDRLVSLVGTDVNRNVISICTQTAAGGGAQNKFLAGVSYSPDGSYVLDTFTGAVSGGGGPDRIGKAIIVYKKDNFAFTVNGITPLRDIIGDIPTCNRLLIFGAARYQPAPSGHIKRLTYYPRALKPNHLQYLTQ